MSETTECSPDVAAAVLRVTGQHYSDFRASWEKAQERKRFWEENPVDFSSLRVIQQQEMNIRNEFEGWGPHFTWNE